MTRPKRCRPAWYCGRCGGKRSGKQSNNRHRDFIFIRKNHDATLSTGNAKFYVEQLRELLQTVPHRGM